MINYTKLIPYIIIAALVAFILISRSCEGETKTIRIPAVVGNIPSAPIIHLEPIEEPLIVKWHNTTIESKNPVNDSLISIYRDSIGQIADELEREKERFRLFVESTALRKFKTTFEDENLKADIEGEVSGYLRKIEMPFYEIKEREIDIPNKKWSLSLYGGYGISKEGLSPQIGVGMSYSLLKF